MIYPVTFGNAKPQNTYQTTQDKRSKNTMEGLKRPRPVVMHKKANAPLHDGLSTALSWFGFGIVLDRITTLVGKHIKTSPFKLSLITNGLVAAGAGLFTYFKSKRKN